MRAPGHWWRKPGLAAKLLSPIAYLYGRIAALRLARRGTRANVPVICVGNPTVGGAGKTPTAIAIARMLIEAGRLPVFLTRGYGGRLRGPVRVDPVTHRATDVGDEPLLLAAIAPTIVSADRVAGARAAEAAGADVIVMDDGFQNPSLHKDVSLLVVDGRRGVGNARVLPSGPLRAPLAAQLARAGALIVVGEMTGATEIVAEAERRGLPVLSARIEPDPATLAELVAHPLLAFAGIGDPGKFTTTLTRAGADVRMQRAYPDHHRFTQTDALFLLNAAKRDQLWLVTTEKDHVRLDGADELAELKGRAVALPITLVFDDPARLRALLPP